MDRVNGKEMKLLGDADVSFVQPAPGLETLVDVFFLVAGPWVLVKEPNLKHVISFKFLRRDIVQQRWKQQYCKALRFYWGVVNQLH